jgi:uncharacterized membrane protein
LNSELIATLHHPLASLASSAIFLGLIVDLIAYKAKHDWLFYARRFHLIIASLAVLLAFLSGYITQEHSSILCQVPDQAIEKHHALSKIAALLTWLSLIFEISTTQKLRAEKVVFRSFLTLLIISAMTCIFITANRGSNLSTNHGAGVVQCSGRA